MQHSDSVWRKYGRDDPYFGVLAHPSLTRDQLNESSKQWFFKTGEDHVEGIVKTIQERFFPEFKLKRALDFGCGVGRLTIPLAKRCELAVGVDISPDMLAEAEKNSSEAGLKNISYVESDDALSRVKGSFNLVHSVIVFQHIPVGRGEVIFRRLIQCLEPDGVAVIQITTYRIASKARKFANTLRKSVPLLNGVLNVAQGTPFSRPMMQMNSYDMSRLLFILQQEGCTELFTQFQNDHGHISTVLYVRKGARQ